MFSSRFQAFSTCLHHCGRSRAGFMHKEFFIFPFSFFTLSCPVVYSTIHRSLVPRDDKKEALLVSVISQFESLRPYQADCYNKPSPLSSRRMRDSKPTLNLSTPSHLNSHQYPLFAKRKRPGALFFAPRKHQVNEIM